MPLSAPSVATSSPRVCVREVAICVAGPVHPKQVRPVKLDEDFLVAPDGSTTSPQRMLDLFVAGPLQDVTFVEGLRYELTLHVEGGLYRFDSALFPGPFELFAVRFLLDGARGLSAPSTGARGLGARQTGARGLGARQTGARGLGASAPGGPAAPNELVTERLHLNQEDGLVLDIAGGQK